MEGKQGGLFVLLFVSSFFVFTTANAAAGGIIINEIGAYAASSHEWVEMFNRGNEPVDISGWKFWENNTNHGLTASGTDSIVDPGEYAVIVQDVQQFKHDYPNFTGSVFDSSWGSLSESGEEIGLKDGGGNIIEQFTYIAAPDFSLERLDVLLAEYSSANWRQHVSGNSVGQPNSSHHTAETMASAHPVTPPPTPLAVSTAVTVSYTPVPNQNTLWEHIKINEIVAHPISGSEWVELYNTAATSVDLTGGILCDSRVTTCTIATLSSTIAAQQWLVVQLSGNKLNNNGDVVFLKRPDGAVVDQVTYGSVVPAPEKGQSAARRHDGFDSNANTDWEITIQPTPGMANIITRPPVKSSGNHSRDTESSLPLPVATFAVGSVFINELYPNPPGADTEGEFIEIRNTTEQAIDLTGWKLADATKKFTLSGSIAPGELKTYARSTTGISLNNSTKEKVMLLSPSDQEIDTVEYASANENASYGRDQHTVWQWSSIPTPGQANNIAIVDTIKVSWQIEVPTSADVGETVVFNTGDTADPRGGAFSFSWDFGDGAIAAGEEVSHAFANAGVYTVVLSATSTNGTYGQKKFSITVGSGLSVSGDGIGISELLPNPEGHDSKEFIELHNSGSSVLNLSGWHLRIKAGKTFTLPPQTFIQPNGFLIFYRGATRLTLDNKQEKVELLTPDKSVVDVVKWQEAPVSYGYALVGNQWQWVHELTPGYETAPGSVRIQSAQAQPKTKTAGRKKTAKFTVASLTQARTMEKGDKVVVEGIVAATPSVFGVQYMYIVNEESGLPIYQHKKQFPPVAIGDRVRIQGTVSEANGLKRVNVANKEAVDILSVSNTLPVVALSSLSEIDDEIRGSLVRVEGEITDSKSTHLYLDDGESEVMVYFKRGAAINKGLFKESDRVAVVGIIEQGKDGLQLWPRSQEDITLVQAHVSTSPAATANTSMNPVAIGLVVLGFAYAAKRFFFI